LGVGAEREDTRRHQRRGGVDQGRVVVCSLEAHDRLPAAWFPAASVFGGQAHAEVSGVPGASQQCPFERLVPTGEVRDVSMSCRPCGVHRVAQELADVIAERGEVVGQPQVNKLLRAGPCHRTSVRSVSLA
jgi:hypothetical protein